MKVISPESTNDQRKSRVLVGSSKVVCAVASTSNYKGIHTHLRSFVCWPNIFEKIQLRIVHFCILFHQSAAYTEFITVCVYLPYRKIRPTEKETHVICVHRCMYICLYVGIAYLCKCCTPIYKKRTGVCGRNCDFVDRFSVWETGQVKKGLIILRHLWFGLTCDRLLNKYWNLDHSLIHIFCAD